MIDGLNAYPDTFLLRVGSRSHPLHHFIGDAHARDLGLHVTRGIGGLERHHPGQYVHLLVQPPGPNFVHEALESFHVEDGLGLNEVRSGLDLLGQAGHAVLEGVGEGVGRCPQVHLGALLDGISSPHLALVPHMAEDHELLNGIDVVDVPGLLLVPEGLVIAREAQHVLYAQGCRPQQVGLHGDAVAVPAGHLHHRFGALLKASDRGGHGGQPHDGRLVIGEVERLRASLKRPHLLPQTLGAGRPRRSYLGRYGEGAALQHPLEVAS